MEDVSSAQGIPDAQTGKGFEEQVEKRFAQDVLTVDGSPTIGARESELLQRVKELEQRVADLSTNETGPDKGVRASRRTPLLRSGLPVFTNKDETAVVSLARDHFIVAIGASAGGQASLLRFLSVLPAGTGCSVVICQHLSANFPSVMADILRGGCHLTVLQVEDGLEVLPEHVYTTPPGKYFRILNGKFAVFDRLETLNTLITFFMSDLADTWGRDVIGVILSGSGTDGKEGIVSIKKCGGFTMAQDSSAQFDGMPSSACETGFVDFVGTPEAIAERVIEICKTGHQSEAEVFLLYNEILQEIEKKSDKSFREYKEGTVIRRIQRQMEMHGCVSSVDYLKELQRSPELVDALQSDIFIHVTNFFRDTKVWTVLQEKVLPQLVLSAKKEVRLWVIGASTGAEAYTYAMILHKVMEVKEIRLHCSIFATDVSQKVIDHASKGAFTKSELANVPVAFVEAYFTEHIGVYTVIGVIRKMVVFAVHDVLHDPPFIKMDLVSCRNLLIYFKQEVQTRVLSLFHYALNKDGVLVLGVSETITADVLHKFDVEDESCKIYGVTGPKSAAVSNLIDSSRFKTVHRVALEHPVVHAAISDVKSSKGRSELESRVDSTLSRLFVPPSVVFNDLNVIVMTFGKLDQFVSLGAQGGAPSLDVLKCARHTGLAALLSIATRRCLAGERNVIFKGFGVPAGEDDDDDDVEHGRCQIVFDVSVHHIAVSGSKFFIASFIETKTTKIPINDQEGTDVSRILKERFKEMEGELVSTRVTLRETVEDLEGANEELQSTVEELLSEQEELQSVNEELQSVNEELTTVNQEYHEKIREVSVLNLDVMNLLSGADIACIFLDDKLNIRKFTKAASERIPLRAVDIGRPLHDLAGGSSPFAPAFKSLDKVLLKRDVQEFELADEAGKWFLIRCLPYEDEVTSRSNSVLGVVLTFFDVSRLRNALEKALIEGTRADAAHAAKMVFLSTMRQDIQAPLNAICGFSELLKNSGELGLESRGFASHISKSSRLLTALLDANLYLASIDTGKEVPLVCEPFSLVEEIFQIAELLSASAAGKGLELVVDLDPRLLSIKNCNGDAVHLRQVLLNLCTSAIKFTNQGCVKIIAKAMQKPDGETLFVNLNVVDTGCGISANKLDGIVHMLANKDSALIVKGEVGLSFAYSSYFVRLMGGSQLYVSSEVGVGTGISFEIPLKLDVGVTLSLPPISGAVHVLVRKSLYRDVLTIMLGSLGVLGTVAENASVDLLEECCLKKTGVQVVILSASNLAEFRLDSLDRLEKLKLSAHIICLDSTLHFNSPKIDKSIYACAYHVVDQIPLDWLVELLSASPQILSSVAPILLIRCLVIEDNMCNQMVAMRFLEALGGSVEVASNGVEVLALCQRCVFDIIFCNVSTRGLDVNHIVESIRLMPGKDSIPIYAIAAAPSLDARSRGQKSGFSGYLTHPILLSSFRTVFLKENLLRMK